jgi:hypothetical protein
MSILSSDDLARTRNILYTDPATVSTTTGTGERGPQGPQGATGPQGPQGATGPQGPQGANADLFVLKASNVNLVADAVTSGGANSTALTYMDGSSFSVPTGKNVIIRDCYIQLTSVVTFGTWPSPFPPAAWSNATTYSTGSYVTRNNLIYVSLQNSNIGKDPATEPTWWLLASWTASSLRCYLTGSRTQVSQTFTPSNVLFSVTDALGFLSNPSGGIRRSFAGEGIIFGVNVVGNNASNSYGYTTLSGNAFFQCFIFPQ